MKWSDNGGKDFEQPPAGTEIARCIRVIDIGTQENEWKGVKNYKRQVIIGFETPNSVMSEGDNAGKPFIVAKFYTASLGKKATLRRDLVNWRGREFTDEELAGFDSKNILGKHCMLSLTEKENGKIAISGIMAAPKGVKIPDQFNPSIFLSLEPGEFDQEVFNGLSEKMKDMIKKSPEYQNIVNPIPHEHVSSTHGDFDDFDDFDDDIPF